MLIRPFILLGCTLGSLIITAPAPAQISDDDSAYDSTSIQLYSNPQDAPDYVSNLPSNLSLNPDKKFNPDSLEGTTASLDEQNTPAQDIAANQDVANAETAETAETANTANTADTSRNSLSASTDAANAADAADADVEALFQRAFGTSPVQAEQQVVVPLWIEEQVQGEVLVQTSAAASETQIQAAPILEKLALLVQPEIQAALTQQVEDEMLNLATLQQQGLEARFDQRRLEVRIQIPPAQRRTNVREGQPHLPDGMERAIAPSTISGYLNVRGQQDFAWSGTNDTGRQPLRLSFDGALNLDGWVLEGRADFTEGGDGWSRGDLRLVRDDPVNAMRYVAGDLSLPVIGYQSAMPMLGVTAARNFSLQPYVVTRPISQYEFFLERPSTVEVYVNGALRETLQLPAGRQDLRNLPLNAGINEVELLITDDVGRQQRLNFTMPIAQSLLAPGVQQFAYSIGFPSTLENRDRTYDFSNPTLTLFHRWGASDTLTLGGYVQGNPERQLVGMEGIFGSSIGNWAWDAALSHDADLGVDVAARLQYDLLRLDPDRSYQRQLRAGIEYRGSRFLRLGDTEPSDTALDLSLAYSQELFDGVLGTLSANYQLSHGEQPDQHRVSLNLSRSLGNGLGLSLGLSHQRNALGQDEQQIRLTLNQHRPLSNQSLTSAAEFNSSGASLQRFNWNYNSPRPIDSLQGSLGVLARGSDYNLTGQLNYTGYRAELSLSHNSILDLDGVQTSRDVTRFNFGTALVFADGHFGWSRPVHDSFALVVPQGNLAGRAVGVNPVHDGYLARSDALGPAVISHLQPYALSQLLIEVPDLPLGYAIGDQQPALLPTYRSGTVIRIGTDATVFLRGTLQDRDGQPIALRTGQVRSLSDDDWSPVALFTNRAGRFATEGLKPGEYELSLTGDTSMMVRFSIPDDTSGLYDVGELQLLDTDD